MTAAEAQWTPKHNPWAIAITVSLATFMEVLDASVANVSLPHIAGSLSVGQDESTWVLTSYLVSNAIVLPLSGWLANKFGRKRFYMTCVALFTLTSMLCGAAPSLGWLVFFRVLQGLGGGGLAPVEQAILTDTFPASKRGTAFAIYGMTVILAPAVGPTLGGLITDYLSWRWVFFINIPVGILSLLLSSRLVEDPPHVTAARDKAGPIDLTGLLLITAGLASLEIVLDKGQSEDWFATRYIVVCSLVAAVCLVAAVVWEWNHEHPIVDVRLFRSRSFALSNLLMLSAGLVHYAATLTLPQFLQNIMRYSAADAGRVLSPGGLVVVLLMPLMGLGLSKLDTRKLAALGFFTLGVSLLVTARTLSTEIDFGTAVLLRAFQCAGVAFLFVPVSTLAFDQMDTTKRNSASGIVNLSRNLGGDIGIALVTTFFARRIQVHQSHLVEHLTLFDRPFAITFERLVAARTYAGATLAHAREQVLALVAQSTQRQAAVLSYLDGMWLIGLLALGMVPLVFLTNRPQPGGATAEH